MNYLILSLKWSPKCGRAVWWGPLACGYFTDIEKAGVYTQEQIDSDPGYYNNGTSTIAVPQSQVVPLAKREVDWNDAKEFVEEPEVERDETPTFDVSARWDGGLHNRPGTEHNP